MKTIISLSAKTPDSLQDLIKERDALNVKIEALTKSNAAEEVRKAISLIKQQGYSAKKTSETPTETIIQVGFGLKNKGSFKQALLSRGTYTGQLAWILRVVGGTEGVHSYKMKLTEASFKSVLARAYAYAQKLSLK